MELTIQDAQHIWKDLYQKPLHPAHIELSEYPFSVVHDVIRSSPNVTTMAHLLATDQSKVYNYLKKYRINSVPLNYLGLKNLSAREIYKIWGQSYYKPLPKVYKSMCQYSLSEIHSVLLNSRVSDAADLLGISHCSLITYLSLHHLPNGSPLTHENLKKLSVDKAQDIWKVLYHTPMYGAIDDIHNTPISKIHSIIHCTDNIKEVNRLFSIEYEYLHRYLGMYRLNGARLTYSTLKHSSAAEIYGYWGELYHKSLPKICTDIYKYPLSFIHKLILDSTTSITTTDLLGISLSDLNVYLSRYRLSDNIPLTYKIMEELSVEKAQEIWQDEYDSSATKSIKSCTFTEIHKTIRESRSEYEASQMLDISIGPFKTYLGRRQLTPYEPATYDYLKNLSPEEAQEKLKDKDYQLLSKSKVCIEKYTFNTIHKMILKSNSLHEAACYLGVHSAKLGIYLGKCALGNEPIYFKYLKSISVEDAEFMWGKNYTENIIHKNIDVLNFSFSKVHQVILDSNSAIEATHALGIADKHINSYLIKFYFGTAPLTYERLKDISILAARLELNDRYDCSLAEVLLSQYSLTEIHKAIWDTNNITEAANQLGLSNSESINIYLRNIFLESTPLTYLRLKSLSISYVQYEMERVHKTRTNIESESVTNTDLLSIEDDDMESILECLLPDENTNHVQESDHEIIEVVSYGDSESENSSTSDDPTLGLDSDSLSSFRQDFLPENNELDQDVDASFDFCDDCLSMDTSDYETESINSANTYDDDNQDFIQQSKRKLDEMLRQNDFDFSSYGAERFFKKHTSGTTYEQDDYDLDHTSACITLRK